MYVATILFTLPMTRIQIMQFAVSISDTPVTVKQNQGHQTYNDNVDPKQDSKYESSSLNGVWEKNNVKVFFKWGNMSICENQN